MGRLQGKVAVITASTAGTGYAIAHRFGVEGATIIISSRKQKNVDIALNSLHKNNIKAYGIVCNGGSLNDIDNLVNYVVNTLSFSSIDILVSNAGTNTLPTTSTVFDENVNPKMYDKIMNVNLRGTFFLIKKFQPYISKMGSIIIMGTSGAYLHETRVGVYCISKLGLLGVTQIFAKDFAKNDELQRYIRVNCILPGLVKNTKMGDSLLKYDYNDAKRLINGDLFYFNKQPSTKDCADLALFLASDESKMITGESIAVCGGLPSRL